MRRDDIEQQAARIDRRARAATAGSAPSTEPLTLVAARRGRARDRRDVRAGIRRVRARAEVPGRRRRSSSSCAAATTQSLAMVTAHARRDGRRRLLRRRRRRLPSLLGGRPLARPALREDALRQRRRSPPTYLHAWVVTGRERYRRGRRGDARLHAPRARARRTAASPRRRTPTPTASRADLHVDARTRSEASGSRASCSSRSSTAATSSAASSSPELRARVLAERDTAARSRSATTRRSRPGTGSRSRRSPRRRYRLERDDWLDAARAARRVPARRRSPREDGRLFRSIRDGRTSGLGFLDDYANVAHGLIELHVATGRAALAARGAAARAPRGRALRRRRARRLLPLARGRRRARRRAREDLQDTPIPSGNSMLASRAAAALRGSGATTSSSGGRSPCSASRSRRSRRAPGFFAWTLCGARPLAQPAARDRDRRATSTSPRRAGARSAPFQPEHGRRRSARRTTCRSSPARASSTARPAVYVCERFACRAPVTEPEDGGRLMRSCLMIEGQEGVTWDDWVRLARARRRSTASRASSAPTTTRAIIRPDARRARRVGDACRPRRRSRSRIRLGTMVSPRDVPASERARTDGT